MDMSFWTAPGLAALGVRRSGGMYRIARQDLMVRLEQLQQAPMEQILSPSAVPGGRSLPANKRSINDIADLDTYSHFVGFYETESFLVDSVRDFLASGLVTGDAAIVVATKAHLNSFDRALMEAGIDLPEARRCGRFIALDASELLAKFMVDGMPDATRRPPLGRPCPKRRKAGAM
jgi:DcmR-like sensory protein